MVAVVVVMMAVVFLMVMDRLNMVMNRAIAIFITGEFSGIGSVPVGG